jgi:hypothetical protein
LGIASFGEDNSYIGVTQTVAARLFDGHLSGKRNVSMDTAATTHDGDHG